MHKRQFYLKKNFLTIIGLIFLIIFINLVIYFAGVNSSKKLSVFRNSQYEIMRIKIYGSSVSKDGNTISGTFSLIDANGNEIAVIERSWNGSYLGVEFCKIKLNGQYFLFPEKIFGKEKVIEQKKDSKRGTKLRKYYTENRECLLLGNDSTKSQRRALYNISLLGIKYLTFLHFHFVEYFTINLSECKTNRYYSITCDKNGNLFVSEI